MAYLKTVVVRTFLSVSAVLGLVCQGVPVFAESGAPPCLPGRIIELFPGAPGCEDADYVVLQIDREGLGDDSAYFSGDIDWWDACRATIEWADYANLGLRAPDAGGSDWVLVGTASVRAAFGIEPDVLIDEPSPLSVVGGEVNTCSDNMTYGFGSEVSAPDVGMALSRDSQGGWISSEPRPINQQGAIGTFTGCDIPDASVVQVPTEEPECFDLEPDVMPTEPDTDVSSVTSVQEPEGEPTSDSSDGEPVTESVVEPEAESEPSSRTDTELQTATSENGGSKGSTENTASAAQGQGATDALDASSNSPGSLNPVSEAATEGCACRLGYARRSTPFLYLLPAIVLALRFRRRNRVLPFESCSG